MSDKGSESFIMTLAATNLPWKIDPAILSRFDRRIHVPLPDEDVRRAVIGLQIDNRGYAFDGDRDQLVARTKGLSGRRISQLCESAVQEMVHQANPDLLSHVKRGQRAVSNYTLKLRPLTEVDFDKAMEGVSSEVSPEQLEQYRRWEDSNA